MEKQNKRLIIQATSQEEFLMVLADFSLQLARAEKMLYGLKKPYQKSKKNRESNKSRKWKSLLAECANQV